MIFLVYILRNSIYVVGKDTYFKIPRPLYELNKTKILIIKYHAFCAEFWLYINIVDVDKNKLKPPP